MSIRRDAYWTMADTVVTSALAFALRIIVAKMLAPDDFGVASIALTVITILQGINDFGMTAALIQRDKEGVTRQFINTTFTASLLITVILTALTVLVFAPWAAEAYDEPALYALILVAGITLLTSPFTTVASALMYREGKFKQNAVIKVVSAVLGMFTAIALLAYDPSPWVVVLQMVVSMVAGAIMLTIAQPHSYALRLDRVHLRAVFGFSTYVMIGGMVGTFQANMGVFVLGLVLSTASVGYFALGVYLTDTMRRIVMSILNRVTFVHFSRNKYDSAFLRDKFVSTVRWNCRALFPLMIGMMLFGPGWAPQVLGSEWESLGPVIFWLSASVVIGTAGGATSNLFKSMGRPGLDLVLSIVTTIGLLLPALYFSGQIFGLEGAAIAIFVVKVVAVALRLFVLHKLVPGATIGAVRVSFSQLLWQIPILLSWLASWMLDIEQWYYQAPFLLAGLVIYAVFELPKAFSQEWSEGRRKIASMISTRGN